MHFARLLRRAGLPVGPAEAVAASAAPFPDRSRQSATPAPRCAPSMIHRREHQDVFDQAFALFWRDPAPPSAAASPSRLLDARRYKPKPAPAGSAARRRSFRPAAGGAIRPRRTEPGNSTAVMTVSERETPADAWISRRCRRPDRQRQGRDPQARLPLRTRRTRRFRPDPPRPAADLLRPSCGEPPHRRRDRCKLARRRRVLRPPPLVVLCDISGSMSRYAQVMLHFLHAVTNDRDRVHSFLFGTRLTNVTRQLRHPRRGSRLRAGLACRPGLVGRHADRRIAGAVQPALVEAGARPGRGRAADHRRAGPAEAQGPWPRRPTGCSTPAAG